MYAAESVFGAREFTFFPKRRRKEEEEEEEKELRWGKGLIDGLQAAVRALVVDTLVAPFDCPVIRFSADAAPPPVAHWRSGVG